MKTLHVEALGLGVSKDANAAILTLFRDGGLSGASALMALNRPSLSLSPEWKPFRSALGVALQCHHGAPLTRLRRLDGRVLQSFDAFGVVPDVSDDDMVIEWLKHVERFEEVFGHEPSHLTWIPETGDNETLVSVAREVARRRSLPLVGLEAVSGCLVLNLSHHGGHAGDVLSSVLSSPTDGVEILAWVTMGSMDDVALFGSALGEAAHRSFDTLLSLSRRISEAPSVRLWR